MKKNSIIDKSYRLFFLLWLVDCILFVQLLLSVIYENGVEFSSTYGFNQYLYGLAFWAIMMNGIWAFFAGIYKLIHPDFSKQTYNSHKFWFKSWSSSVTLFTIFAFPIPSSLSLSNDNELIKFMNTYENIIFGICIAIIVISFIWGVVSYLRMLFIPHYIEKVKNLVVLEGDKFEDVTNHLLEDVLFIPRRKNYMRNFFVFGLILTIGVLGFLYIIFLNEDNKLQNNIVDQETIETPVNDNRYLTNSLRVENISSFYNKNSIQVKGTVRNLSSSHAKDIILRVDFFDKEKGTMPFDTRFIKLDYVASNGAYTFNEIVNLNYNKEYWFNVKVESAMKF